MASSEVTRFAKLFDHSIVRPDASQAEVGHVADTAARLGTATLTVQPHYIRFAADRLRGSGVLVGTVVGFPHGNETPSIPALKNHERELFVRDVEGVVRAAQARLPGTVPN